tara:strand:+ start:1681 stop:1953 length:273 start_codon:yes stop_codon:yes gene_type:complete
MKLFEDDFGIDTSAPDATEITTTILYFSKEEMKLFKQLCKKGMQKEMLNLSTANISDFLLLILKQKYENLQIKETPDSKPISETQGNFFG